jgi:hypothetical protein
MGRPQRSLSHASRTFIDWLPAETQVPAKRSKTPPVLRKNGCRASTFRTPRFSMTASVLQETELAIPVDDVPGAEEAVLSTVTQRGANVRALCSYNDRDRAMVLLVAEDPPRAREALEDAGFDCRAHPVVVVGLENRIGAIDQLGLHLHKAGINVVRSYASYARDEEAYAVFKTRDDARAIKVLQAGLLAKTV